MKRIKMGLLASAVMIFTACGGGGGGGGDTFVPVSFPSDSILAEPTLENGLKVRDAVVTNQADNVPILNGINDNSKMNPALLSGNIAKDIVSRVKNTNLETYSLNEAINETEACPVSGTINISGEGDLSGGYITMTFDSCNDGEVIIDGSIYMSVSNYDSSADNYRDIAMKFTTDFTSTLVLDGSFGKIVKGSYMNIHVSVFDIYGEPEEFNASISIQSTNGVEVYGIENGVYYYSISGPDTAFYQTQGRVYIDNLATYVDYDTTYDMSATPFLFLSGVIDSGEARYNMADGGKVTIRVINGTVYTYVDVDGDGTPEFVDPAV